MSIRRHGLHGAVAVVEFRRAEGDSRFRPQFGLMSQPNRQPPSKPVVVPTQSASNGPPFTAPAKQPMLKGYAVQLAHGTGPQSAFKRAKSPASGRLHDQPDGGCSSQGSAGQGQRGSTSAVEQSAGPACAGRRSAPTTSVWAQPRDNQEKHEFQVADKGKPQMHQLARKTEFIPLETDSNPFYPGAARRYVHAAICQMRYEMRLLGLPGAYSS